MKYRHLTIEPHDEFGRWIDSEGQLYIWKTRNGKKVLCPIFKHSPKGLWTTMEGFRRINTMLQLCGPYNDFYILWNIHSDTPMCSDNWLESNYGVFSKLFIYCPCCKNTVSVSINSIRQGQRPGCICISTQLQHWRNRWGVFAEYAEKRNLILLTDEETWKHKCHGRYWCPTLKCRICNTIFDKTSINGLQNGCIGCRCTQKLHYRERRDEVVTHALKKEIEVLSTKDDWLHCTGIFWKPRVKCLRCTAIITETAIVDIIKGNLRCRCPP